METLRVPLTRGVSHQGEEQKTVPCSRGFVLAAAQLSWAADGVWALQNLQQKAAERMPPLLASLEICSPSVYVYPLGNTGRLCLTAFRRKSLEIGFSATRLHLFCTSQRAVKSVTPRVSRMDEQLEPPAGYTTTVAGSALPSISSLGKAF